MALELVFEKDRAYDIDPVTHNVIECIRFWNRENEDIYQRNLDGTLGTHSTNEYARKTQQDDWLNEMILTDCKTMCNGKNGQELGYTCGRTRSHVWLHKGNERVMMIYAKKLA